MSRKKVRVSGYITPLIKKKIDERMIRLGVSNESEYLDLVIRWDLTKAGLLPV